VVEAPNRVVHEALLLGFEGGVRTLHVVIEFRWEVDE
jgi:hypothetical protein